MKLAPYPEYKESGVPWLGKIPVHWDETKLKRVSHVQTGVTLGKRYEKAVLVERPYLRVANVQNGFLNLKHVKTVTIPAKEAESAELRTGDVVITEGGDIDKLGRGAIWNGEIEHCLHQNHIFAIRPVLTSLIPGFLSRMMESHHGRSYFYLTSKRTTNLASTNQTTLGLLPLFLPSIEEQTQIARFLDWKSAQINKFIRNKRQLIELLKEQKQNVINQAVTRGLDPSIKLKPSGVEWIGDIPEHWEVAPLKHLASINARVLPESTDENYIFKYIDISSVGTGRLTAEPETLRFGQGPSRARRVLKKGDTILSTVRTYLKAVYYVSDDVEDWIASTGFAALTPKREMHPPFLGLLIQSDNFINRVIRESIGVAYPAISETKLGTLHLAYPVSFEEQQAILEHIADSSKAIDQAITRAEREIELMREYRTRLISDVVTGQVDVRGIEVPEVAEEELLALDEDTAEADDVIDDEMEAEVEE